MSSEQRPERAVGGDTLFALLLALVAAAAGLRALEFAGAAGLMPRAVSLAIVVLVAGMLVRDLWWRRRGRAASSDDAADEAKADSDPTFAEVGQRRATFLLMGATVLYAAVAVLFGILVSSALFLLLAVRYFGSGWTIAIATAAVFPAGMYVLFAYVLRASLPGGLIVPLP